MSTSGFSLILWLGLKNAPLRFQEEIDSKLETENNIEPTIEASESIVSPGDNQALNEYSEYETIEDGEIVIVYLCHYCKTEFDRYE